MAISRLSIIVPVYNERETIVPVLRKLMDLPLPEGTRKEVVVVDDASTDGSGQVLAEFVESGGYGNQMQFHRHFHNKGKGGSIATALKHISGDYFIIQDADLELDPADMLPMMQLVNDGAADVVYGSRFLNCQPDYKSLSGLANGFLTWFSNVSFGTSLTDMETCYKLIPASAMNDIVIREMRFGFEPEITAKLSRGKKHRFAEVPVRYQARTNTEGKKIGWKDGVRAVWCIIQYGILKKS